MRYRTFDSHPAVKMCYYILDTQTEEIVVRSMVRSAEETSRPNLGYEAKLLEAQKFDELTKLKDGNCPIITYNNNPDDQRHSIMEFAPEKLIDLYIQETYTTRYGKERKIQGQLKKYLGDNLFHVALNNGKQRTSL